LWGWAKEEVYRAKLRTMEQMEDRIRNLITNVPHNFLQKTVDSNPSRLRKLVDAAGAYVELLSYASIFPSKKVHVKIIFVIFVLEI